MSISSIRFGMRQGPGTFGFYLCRRSTSCCPKTLLSARGMRRSHFAINGSSKAGTLPTETLDRTYGSAVLGARLGGVRGSDTLPEPEDTPCVETLIPSG